MQNRCRVRSASTVATGNTSVKCVSVSTCARTHTHAQRGQTGIRECVCGEHEAEGSVFVCCIFPQTERMFVCVLKLCSSSAANSHKPDCFHCLLFSFGQFQVVTLLINGLRQIILN